MYSRRTFHRLALAAGASSLLSAKPDSRIHGVRIGVQTYSFRDRSIDEALKAISDVGLSYVELWSGHIEPPNSAGAEAIKKWRTSPDTLQQMKDIRRKFNQAGVRIYALNYSFKRNHTDEEVLHGMAMAKTLGTRYITASSTVDQAPRLNKLAKQADVIVAVHNHSNLKDPNEFATPESFEKAMTGNPNIEANFDIGHYTAANFEPVSFLEKHHNRIRTIHIKDRKKDQGSNVPFGEGDTKIKEVLQLMRTRRWQFPAMIEYEYKGADAVEEVRKCYEYCRKVLA